MDETYVGGKPRADDRRAFAASPNARSAASKWGIESKVQVFGAVERKGRVTAHVVPSRQKSTLMAHVARRVESTAVVHTDTAHAYDKLHQDHHTVNHHEKVFVSGDVHTQTIDGFWSLVKRGISGTHHAVSPKWLQGYLNEYVWRYNHRDDPRAMFALLLLRSANPVR
jgi:transposase-like protein